MRGWWVKSIIVLLLGWAILYLVTRGPDSGVTMRFGLAILIGLALFGQLPALWWRWAGGNALVTILLCFAGPVLIFGGLLLPPNTLPPALGLFVLGALVIVVAPLCALLISLLVKPGARVE